MTNLGLLLGTEVALLALGFVSIPIARRPFASAFVYGGALAISLVGLVVALGFLLSGEAPQALVLPIGLPWIGAHFRLDALSSFFLTVVDLGAAAASLFALGYGRREHDPERVLPFYPAFLAGMGLVPLADDAFVFLVCWEFMSLASWALVMAHHREAENARAGFVYIVMASFGVFALLFALGLLAGVNGGYQFSIMRAASPSAAIGRLGPGSRADRRGIKSGPRPAARLAAARPPGRSEPRFGVDERRDDQGRGLRLRPDCF